MNNNHTSLYSRSELNFVCPDVNSPFYNPNHLLRPEQASQIHNQPPRISIERKPEVLKRTGFSRSTLHNRINQGLFVPPISLGDRAVGWPEHETSAILLAMVAGKAHQEILLLVCSLVESRQQLGNSK